MENQFTDEEYQNNIRVLASILLEQEKKTVVCIPIPDDIDLKISVIDQDKNTHTIKLQNEIVVDYFGINYFDMSFNSWIKIRQCNDRNRNLYEYALNFFIDKLFQDLK